MADTLEEPLDTEETESSEAPPERVPLGTYAPFDVSDQKEWTKADLESIEGNSLKLAENIRAMVEAACRRESLGRRLEVSQAWRLQLMDRGFHRLIPGRDGAWAIYGQSQKNNYNVYGAASEANLHDVNVIGVHNDIIVNALCRDVPKTEFDPKTDDDKAITAAAQSNKLKTIIAQDASYKKAQRKVGRAFCTDERVCLYMRPVADVQRYGYEDDNPEAVPETEETLPDSKPSKRPRIQTELRVFGKLEHKCQIANDDDEQSPYQILAWEEDTASERATFPWIAKEITGGSAGIAEIELDRKARQAIKLSIEGGQTTGQGNVNDTSRLQCWLTPKFYWDDSCSDACRDWLLTNFPKGLLAVYSGVNLAFVRNESWQEVLTVLHARTGKGQNRRSLTEAYAGPNLVLDNLFDLAVKYFTSTVPRTYYDAKVFNVPQLRSSGNTPGAREPFNSGQVVPNVAPIMQDPLPNANPALGDFILWLQGPLAQLLTGAQLTLQGAQTEGDQGTLGEAQMDNDSAMTRLSEPWAAICAGFGNATLQAVAWNARVQPKGKVFDRITKDQGRIRVEMANINANLLVTKDDDANIPESFTEREERIWALVQAAPTNPVILQMLTDPANAAELQKYLKGLKVRGAASWEKQEGEFALLLSGAPQPNPQYEKLQTQMMQLKQQMDAAKVDVESRQATGQPIDIREGQMLQQGLQAMQQLQQQMQQVPPLISSVPVRPDNSEEHGTEALCCFWKMISPDGRRLASSQNEQEQAAFANLHLHWFQHQQEAAKQAQMNAQPLEPKASISVAVDKLPPQVQATLLQRFGLPADPASFEEMGPHEVTHEVEGTNAQGAREKVTTSMVGKSLN